MMIPGSKDLLTPTSNDKRSRKCAAKAEAGSCFFSFRGQSELNFYEILQILQIQSFLVKFS